MQKILENIVAALYGWARHSAIPALADLLRHARGQPCQRQVITHEFAPGDELSFPAGRCIWLPGVTADWCRIPRRCHALIPDRENQDA